MILVIGASGTTGGQVVRELLARGAPVRGLVRSEAAAERLRAAGAEAAVGDLDDPASLGSAFRGVERMYLVTPLGPRAAEQERTAISAGEQAGVYHCVKLGSMAQSPESPLRFARLHAESTETLQGSSLRWTVLMSCSFMQSVLETAPAIAQGGYPSSLGDARIAYIDAHDVAAIAARALAEEGFENSAYTLTGAEALSGDDVARTLTDVLGREVRHVRLSDDEMADRLRRAGVPDWTVDGLIEAWRDVSRAGASSTVTGDAEALLGRRPRSFREFATEHREAFAAS